MADVIAILFGRCLPISCDRCCATVLFFICGRWKATSDVVTLDGWLADGIANVTYVKPHLRDGRWCCHCGKWNNHIVRWQKYTNCS